MALVIALALGVLSFVMFMFSRVPVDDRDEALPTTSTGGGFRAVYLEARSILTGDQVRSHDVSIFEAHGPAVIIYGLIPLAILVGVFVAFRRSPSSRPLTIGMLALAVLVLLAGGITFMPSLIALGVGSFQARRAEIPARMAERAEQQQADDEDEDDDEELLDDEDYEDEYDEDEYVDEDEDLDDEDYDDEELADEDEDDVVDEDDEVVAAAEAEDVDEDAAVEDEETGTATADEAKKPARGSRKR
jgi:hypothetical protein